LFSDLVPTTVITVAVDFPLGYFSIGQQVKLAMMAARLDRAARTDDLTSLANRRTFFEEAPALIARDDLRPWRAAFHRRRPFQIHQRHRPVDQAILKQLCAASGSRLAKWHLNN